MTAADGSASAAVNKTGRPNNRKSHGVYKTGHLSVSSKGLGWKSWKRRWFLLTRTTLIFFKHEPRGPIDASLALGGIDLNSSGRVQVKGDKKQLTLSFPDGRVFTLKTDTTEEVEEWRDALECALASAPSTSLLLGLPNDALLRHDAEALMVAAPDAGMLVDGLPPGGGLGLGLRERLGMKSLVVGRPILLALEDIDGSPSFLERALCFIESQGVGVEGILRASGDVELVEMRLREYEEGKHEFGDGENAHVIGDCIKHILRELPSSPVPASCCSALLQASRIEEDQGKVEASRVVVHDLFPEPNRRLVQRLLRMMRTVAENEPYNRMSTGAVAACMAPLLFRPLFTGEPSLAFDGSAMFGTGGGGGGADPDSLLDESKAAAQIMAATQAANQAQSMAMFLMDNFDSIFHGQEDESRRLQVSGVRSRTGTSSAWEGDRGLVESQGETETEMEQQEVVEADKEGHEAEEEGGLSFKAGVSRESPNTDDEECLQVEVLETARQDLRTSLAREVRANEMLKESLSSRKRMLMEERRTLLSDLERMREALQAQREAHAKLHIGILGAAPQIQLDPEIKREVKEIEAMEQDVARMRTEMDCLQRQLVHVQQKQQSLHTLSSPRGAQGHPLSATNCSAARERRQRIESLQSIKAQLQKELERTMAMCLEEQQKNTELDQRRKLDDPAALESAVAQQRSALSQAQAALEAEMARGKELRRRMQLAQQKAQAAAAAPPSSTPSLVMLSGALPLPPEEDDPSLLTRELKDGDNAAGQDAGRLSMEASEENSFALGGPNEVAKEFFGDGVSSVQKEQDQAFARGSRMQPEAAAAELNARLEQYKRQRAVLMQRLSALSSDVTASSPGNLMNGDPGNGGGTNQGSQEDGSDSAGYLSPPAMPGEYVGDKVFQ